VSYFASEGFTAVAKIESMTVKTDHGDLSGQVIGRSIHLTGSITGVSMQGILL